VQQLEDARGGMDALAAGVGALRKEHDAVAETLETLRAARAELERSQAAHADVSGWLAETDAELADLKERVGEVDAASHRIDQARAVLDDLMGRSELLEERKRLVSSLEGRLDALGTLSNSLDERMRVLEQRRSALTEAEGHAQALNERLDDADRRFQQVAARADEAGTVELLIDDLLQRVGGAEERVRTVEGTVAAADRRAVDVEALARRVEAAGRELEQREKTLQRSLTDLERTTTLRQELSEAVRNLGDEERRVSHAVAAAAEQASLMSELADQVEGRVGNLRFAEKRITQFEEKLAAFEQSERNLERLLQEVAARQESVHVVRGEVGRLFTAVEGTVSDVRTITDARQEIQRTRAVLDEVLERAARVDELALSVERKKTEIGDAETRMARLDTLVTDIQGSLETVRSQKAVVDAFLEKAGQLAFQAKEAEALIAALKEERDLAARVLDAVRDARGQPGAGAGLNIARVQ
jgi:chromosome segregation ATPase